MSQDPQARSVGQLCLEKHGHFVVGSVIDHDDFKLTDGGHAFEDAVDEGDDVLGLVATGHDD